MHNDEQNNSMNKNGEENTTSSQDAIDAMMADGVMDVRMPPPSQASSDPFEITRDFSGPNASSHDTKNLDAVYDIPVQLSVVLGKAHMPVNQLLKLGRGAVVELDRRVGEAVDIYVNNKLIARGEVVLVEDRLGVTMTEIIKSDRV